MRKLLWQALLILSFVSSPLPAAAHATTGSISGTITDQSRAVLPGVAVEVVNTDTGVSRTLVTDADGRFRVLNLPPGPIASPPNWQASPRSCAKGSSSRSATTFHPIIGFDRAGDGQSDTDMQRPSWAPGRNAENAITGDIDGWFDPEAFVLPAGGGTWRATHCAGRTSGWSTSRC